MDGNIISFESVIKNGIIRLPKAYRETFTTAVLVTIRESIKEETLMADEITARLNEIYNDNPAVIEDDILLAQYNLVGDEDW